MKKVILVSLFLVASLFFFSSCVSTPKGSDIFEVGDCVFPKEYVGTPEEGAIRQLVKLQIIEVLKDYYIVKGSSKIEDTVISASVRKSDLEDTAIKMECPDF